MEKKSGTMSNGAQWSDNGATELKKNAEYANFNENDSLSPNHSSNQITVHKQAN